MHDLRHAAGDRIVTEPTNRAALGHLLRLLVTTNPYGDLGAASKRRVIEYIDAAEDTIAAQARMLLDDAESVARRVDEIDRLRAENATLRKVAIAAVRAVELALASAPASVHERLAAIRTELEQIS